ncbi:hypothetical protein DH2020_044663 [Rehmannia glutinosa]|uniref:Uncharacterized protein n=1 Tax=Rehmannia glutinosa TaxID=99300 RepID=A0ABR0UH11_REHGL
MASKPGILTEWPWTWLGNFKYVVLAPWAIHATYSYMVKDENERVLSYFLVLPLLVSRMVHNQLWISLSRYRTAKGNNRIVDKTIEFEQVDRERNWDDQIILNGILMYLGITYIESAKRRCTTTSFTRYHSHHHSSIVTEPITSVIHPFAEHIAYYVLFAIPMLSTLYMWNGSIISIAGYVTYIDFMNNMGHCNFEHIPKWLFSAFPPLKYLMYTPSYHSLHHTQFRTNYSLFMPFYDYVYSTLDKSSDTLYETSLVRKEEAPDVVHLTHLTTPESIYHLRLGFAYLASQPHKSKWYLWLMWPVTVWSMMVTWIYGRTFTVERNVFKHLKLQTWAIPKYSIQYYMQWQRESINAMIEDSILEAETKGVKEEGLNENGELFLRRHPQLKVKLVDGSSLAVAVVLNSIRKEQLKLSSKKPVKGCLLHCPCLMPRGNPVSEDEHKKLKSKLSEEAETIWSSLNTMLQSSFAKSCKLIIADCDNESNGCRVGDGLSEDEQLKASKGTVFIPFSHFPPKKMRKDCYYNSTPAMLAPKHLENVDSCENWLPRRVMSAWRIAGILHAMEEWNVNECGNMMFNIEKSGKAALSMVFAPDECHRFKCKLEYNLDSKLKPSIDALSMEAMAALRKFSVGIAIANVV